VLKKFPLKFLIFKNLLKVI